VPSYAKLCQAVPSCAKLCQAVPSCAKLCQAVPPSCASLPNCAHPCTHLAMHRVGILRSSQNGVFETWVGLLPSPDGTTFSGEPKLALPRYDPRYGRRWPLSSPVSLTHNYAVLRQADGSYVAVGGTHNRFGDGIWTARSRSLIWNLRVPTSLAPVYGGAPHATRTRCMCAVLVYTGQRKWYAK
jgi:hypothetical protein